MSRWIDADHLRKWILSWWERTEPTSEFLKGGDILNQIDREPSIDIVFCEECRDCVEKGTGADCPSGYGYLYCRRKKSIVNEDDYCSWGVRR